jgi:sulfoxide reductase catalytic subunit YedY
VLITRSNDIRSSEITDRKLYLTRREFMLAAGGAAAGIAACAGPDADLTAIEPGPQDQQAPRGQKLPNVVKSPLSTTDERLNTWEQITTYNNYYEFGIDKESPSLYAGSLKTDPWSIMIDGECGKRGSMNLEDILRGETLEERVYRLRCVEAWSMVIPWVGFPIANLIKKCEPNANARFVEFVTLEDSSQMPGLRQPVLEWPYREGLRMDEAMHPLAILAVGLYGQTLPNQNGAPIRIIVPWKYGFKSAKSIVRIRFTADEPVTTWQRSSPKEYGFYSNVNPTVNHPRWSQETERRIGEFFHRKTLMFNGYGDQVASLYAGMDLTRNF